MTEPAASIRSTVEAPPVSRAGLRQWAEKKEPPGGMQGSQRHKTARLEGGQKKARLGHGWPGGRKMAGTGFEPATSRL
jgi:hypothetical protein